uniref:Uncharacterized protein n=1 Tax=Myoviridae sp. ctCo31 TaxID=2825053 RepID=A0A8S5UME6_9CAUD|nr:MAG TPA: hypothetical protein [Myoviridae sp. ctCo31]
MLNLISFLHIKQMKFYLEKLKIHLHKKFITKLFQ